jgi:alpha-amylase
VPRRALLPILLLLCACHAGAAQSPPRGSAPGVCYEIFVRSFQDSGTDGVGDLLGLIQRLDHLNDGDPSRGHDLGVDCIWLMPVAESPSYHGYDVVDYYHVDRDYGTDDDFRRLMSEAHRRGIRVIVDLVLNHSSSLHPNFQQALNDPTSPYRAWYRFLPAHPGVKNPWGGDNWHRSAAREEWYYAFFWQGMPDLDYTSRPVREEARRIARHWLQEMGADGFRLDAVSFLVEESHSAVQHTAGTKDFLREFGGYVRSIAPRSFTVGEVWDSTATLASYYPDQLDAYFSFEVSDSIMASVRSGAAAGVLSAIDRAQRTLPGGRWASFLRNHDQERTVTALGGDLRGAKLAATILLTSPGIPFVYYGEEIGMRGGKDGQPEGDMGVRTPMQWSAERGAGFTDGRPWHAPRSDWRVVNVAAQRADSASLLTHYRELIRLRTGHASLREGDWVPLSSSHGSIAAYLRRTEREVLLVVLNLATVPIAGASLTSPHGVLPAGSYRPRGLIGPPPAALQIASDGRIEGYVPVAALPARSAQVIQLR